ncbi:MAG: 6-bladed beta-propeller [Acidobacteriota bacterium]|nr:6-bladed beta-propeller [Acidobacteriota bacterium]
MKHSLCLLLVVGAVGTWAADVPQIDNNPFPNGKVELTFEEDLRIGPDSDEDYLIWSGSLITCEVNTKGHIFIVDSGGNRILEFNPDGKFLRQHGREGRGPGEFQKLYSFQIMNDDSAVAFDNTQNSITVSRFDSAMNFVDRTPNMVSGKFIQSLNFSRDNRWAGALWITFEDRKVHTGILGRDMKPKLALTHDNQVIFDQSRAGDPNWWIQFLADWFKIPSRGTAVFGFDWDGTVYTAINNHYEITRYDKDMKPNLLVTRKYKRIHRSEEHLEAVVQPVYDELMSLMTGFDFLTPALVRRAIVKADLPPAKPPVYAIFPMVDGYFIVVHNYDAVSGEVTGDIFDKEGRYAGVTQLPKIPVNIFSGMFGGPTKLIFRNGYAYGMQEDEGDLYMVRYKTKLTVNGKVQASK